MKVKELIEKLNELSDEESNKLRKEYYEYERKLDEDFQKKKNDIFKRLERR